MNSLPQSRVFRAFSWTLLLWLFWASAASWALADPPAGGEPAVAADGDGNFFVEVLRNLFNSRQLLETLAKPQFAVTAFIMLNLIVFMETGLMIFFLPGDSLLVTAGVAAYLADWNMPLLITSLCLSAIVGDSVSYSIGYKSGPRIFNREKSWFFNKDHLLKAQAFYEKHGGKTIILARFMPIIRTFAPVVAGVGRMHYPRFLFFNIFGGVGWVVSMVLIGYYLTDMINPFFRNVLGNPAFDVKDHIEKVVVIVVLLSISPAIYLWLRKKLKGKSAPAPESTKVSV
ncbi:MAG: VTT domain-containing protein [Gemmataceae bacterium]|nr:VTT domain-containing protein [Gemmataceae bacterium]MCI0743416.1 VTT domain-containing protein [Gemmataceae bacterium]